MRKSYFIILVLSSFLVASNVFASPLGTNIEIGAIDNSFVQTGSSGTQFVRDYDSSSRTEHFAFSSSFSSANLATGELKALTPDGNAVHAQFADRIFIGGTVAGDITVQLSLHIEGTGSVFVSLGDPTGGATGSSFYGVVDEIITHDFLINASDLVLDFYAYILVFGVSDFSNTAQLGVTLPSDLSFTSQSGVLLTQISNNTVPEPTTLALLSLGLFGLGFNRRKRI